jgi:serine/threonine protein kinase
MPLAVDQLKALSAMADRWLVADAAQQARLLADAVARGEAFERAFSAMILQLSARSSATLLPPISEERLAVALAAANPPNLTTDATGARAELTDAFPTRQSGQHVGPYRLIKEVGRGGMGVVWLAERADGQHSRQVALKMPLVENLNWLLAARFARERNILASLEHPSIARLYDAGVDEKTQPYIAIEYVQGVPITHYVREKKLKPEATAQLFIRVIEAVAHAHTQLVIHRDVKPSNILVDAKGEPHLLDFGIAKLLEDEDSQTADATQLTRLSGRALTLDYASPEQVNNASLGTASDVYSLGIVLYELLTSSRPYRPKGPTRRDLEQAILDQDPSKPSDQLLTANTGDSESGKSARRMRGDLDTVVLKALRKDPKQRYATAQAFADDLRRYLAYEPIAAKPDAGWYRFGRFVRRNRVAVVGAVLLSTVLAAGVASTLWQAGVASAQALRANAEALRASAAAVEAKSQAQRADEQTKRTAQERDRADVESRAAQRAADEATRSAAAAQSANAAAQRASNEAAVQRDDAIAQRTVAQSEANRARVVSDFLSGLFRSSSTHQVDPVKARETTAAELLERGAARADDALRDDPRAREEVWRTVGEIYLQLGEQKKAGELVRKRYQSVVARGADDRETVRAGIDLANVLYENGEVKPMSDLVFSLQAPAKKLSADTDAALLGANAVMHARALEATHRAEAAEALLRQSIEYFRVAVKQQPAVDLSVYIHTLRYLATYLASRNRGVEALVFFDEAVAYLSPRKARFPTVAAALEGGRGNILRRLARDREAIAAYENSIAMYRQALPDGHVGEVYVNEYLADVAANVGDHTRAEKHAALSLEGYARFFPAANEEIAAAQLAFAEIARKAGRPIEACTRSLALLSAAKGKPEEGRMVNLRGDQVLVQCIDAGRIKEAATLLAVIRNWQQGNPTARVAPQLHAASAYLFAAQGDWATARVDIAKAMLMPPRTDAPLPPSWIDVLLLKCRIELGAGNPKACDEPMADVDRALSTWSHLRDRPLLVAHFKDVQARRHALTGRKVLAIETLRDAITALQRTQPSDSAYLDAMKRALAAIERVDAMPVLLF